MEPIKTRLRQLYVETLRLPIAPDDLGEANLVADWGIDSIVAMELLTRVENRFQIVIDDADVSPSLVDSLDALSDYIARKQAEHRKQAE